MSTTALEQTVNDLQRRVTEIEHKLTADEAMRLGAEWRARANAEGH
ncbi:MAG: hypothetical protein ACOYOF_06780 [Verrucomicrobiaceae bacterium]